MTLTAAECWQEGFDAAKEAMADPHGTGWEPNPYGYEVALTLVDHLARRAGSYEASADALAASGCGADASALRTVAGELRRVAREVTA